MTEPPVWVNVPLPWLATIIDVPPVAAKLPLPLHIVESVRLKDVADN